jgi:hypothetical protein
MKTSGSHESKREMKLRRGEVTAGQEQGSYVSQ